MQIFFDLLIALILVLVWMWHDAKRQTVLLAMGTSHANNWLVRSPFVSVAAQTHLAD